MAFTTLPAFVSQTTNYTLLGYEDLVEFNATSGNLTATMPSAVSVPVGKPFTLKKTDSGTNTVTINSVSSQTFDTTRTSIVLRQNGDYLTVKSDGSNWQIVSKKETEGYQAATGNQTTTGQNGNYMAMSSNSIALTPGIWRISANFDMFNAGVNAGIYGFSGVYGANGANSSSAPAGISNSTILHGYSNMNSAFNTGGDIVLNCPSATNTDALAGQIDMTLLVTANTTIFVVPVSYNPSNGAGFIRATMMASRIF